MAESHELNEVELSKTVSPVVQGQLQTHGLELVETDIVRWRKGNPDHPRNWQTVRKAYDTWWILVLEFLTRVIGIAGTSATDQAQEEYGISRSLAIFAFFSTFQIGSAIGGTFLPPYTESFGRKNIYVVTTLLTAVSSVISGAVPSLAAVVVGRFATGLLAAVPDTVATGSIEDIYIADKRTWIIFAWETAAMLGLAVGPIFGTYVATGLGWRWVFYLGAIASAVLAAFLATMKESRPSKLLHRKVVLLREATRPNFRFENPDQVPDTKTLLTTVLTRPLRLFFTEPIISSIALMGAIVYGIVYLFTGALPIVYASYGFTLRQSSLAFIPLAIGPFFGILSRLYETRTLESLRRRHEYIAPEAKLFGFSFAAPVLAVGLWIFAWTVRPAVNAPFMVSLVALIPIGFAMNEYDYTLAIYLTESYTCFASSAYAPVAIIRCLFAAAVPLFGEQMYRGLGVNVASSILAIAATVFCAAPLVFTRYGKALRMRSPFAQRSVSAEHER